MHNNFFFFSYSDSEQESDVMAAIGQLSQRLAKQREGMDQLRGEIDQLRVDQRVQFQTLSEKLDGLTQTLIGAQRTTLAENAKEQRILTLCCKNRPYRKAVKFSQGAKFCNFHR